VALPLEHLEGGPVAYVSLGTVYNERPDFRTVLRAFGGTGWRVVVATGTWVDTGDLGPVPDNVILQPWVPQLEMLAKADVFVGHGAALAGGGHDRAATEILRFTGSWVPGQACSPGQP
jgi:UDP:flavonoid glycosyltransferase YjiC (YdhE family)